MPHDQDRPGGAVDGRFPSWVGWLAGAALLALGLGLRLWWVQEFPGEPTHDQLKYLGGAKRLAKGGGLDNTYWPVGYKLLLAALIKTGWGLVETARQVNVLLSMGSMLCTYRLARVGTGSTAAALVALALVAFNPIDIAYCSLLVTEPLFTFLMLAAATLALTVNAGRAAQLAAGALSGLAALTRAHGMFLPALLAMAAQARSRRLRTIASVSVVMYLGLALCMSPWWWRNASVLGTFVATSSNGGMNLLIGNNEQATGAYTEDEAALLKLLSDRRAIDGRGGGELAQDARARELALEYMVAHPLRVLGLVPAKLAAFFAPDSTPITWNKSKDATQRRALRAWKPALLGYHVLLYAAGSVGLLWLIATGWRNSPRLSAVCADWHPVMIAAVAICLCLALVHAVYFGGPRFHFPLLPWLAVLAVAPLGRRISG